MMMIVRNARTWRSFHIPQTLNPSPRRACSPHLQNFHLPYYSPSDQASASKIQVAYADDDEKELGTVDSYTIRGTKVVKAGDSVLMQLPDFGPKYVGRIEKIMADNQNNAKVRVRRYYRPEEDFRGRGQFHGYKELFLSDQYDVQSASTIENKSVVHSFRNYMHESLGAEDYYCRFEYNAATGAFKPDMVAVYCKCEMPRNPDAFMVQCRECGNWFHPACVNMSPEVAKTLEYFTCSDCEETLC